MTRSTATKSYRQCIELIDAQMVSIRVTTEVPLNGARRERRSRDEPSSDPVWDKLSRDIESACLPQLGNRRKI